MNQSQLVDGQAEEFSCPVCHKTFMSRIELGGHASEHGYTKTVRTTMKLSRNFKVFV